MKPNRFYLLSVLLWLSSLAFAQHDEGLYLRTGKLVVKSNLRQSLLDSFNTRAPRFLDRAFSVFQFDAIPTQQIRNQLSAEGIELLDYLPEKAYTASIRGALRVDALQQAKVKSLVQLEPVQKMEPRLANGILPPSSVKIAGTVDVWISFPK